MKKTVLAIVLLIEVSLCHATTFTEDGSIDSGTYGSIYIEETATVDMTGGTIDTVEIQEAGTLNFYDGTIIDEVYIWNSGTFNLEGASFSPVQNLFVTNAGLFNMNSGTFNGTIELTEYVEVNINDGQITDSLLDSMGYSITNIYGGQHDFEDIWLRDFSILNIYGGDLSWWTASVNENSILNIYGGNITSELDLNRDQDAQINVYYSDMVYDEYRGENIIGYLLLDGSEFMLDSFTHSEIDQMNFEYIPEPATILLFTFGGLLLRS